MVVGFGQGVHDQGVKLPLFIHHSLRNLICHLAKEVDLQRIDQGPVGCREICDSGGTVRMYLLVEMIAIPPDVVREFGEMVCSPTCHPVLKLGFKGSKAQGICVIFLILQD